MLSFQQVLNSSPQVKEYFGLYAKNAEECMRLALELMKEAIARRNKESGGNKLVKGNNNSVEGKKQQQSQAIVKPKTNHYNVAYIKHNRFLSPSQKKQITPKVTEIIPIPSQNHVIYGKPKVKLDQFEGCEIHRREDCWEGCYDNNSSSGQQQNTIGSDIQMTDNKMYDDGVQMLQNQQHQQAMQIPYQYEEYLSPKNNKVSGKKKNGRDWNKTVKGTQKEQRQNQAIHEMMSPKGNKQTNTSSKTRMTSPKSQLFNNQGLHQNYANVESKIKQLIMRDKRNREVEKQVQKQNKQIQEIEERQNKLLIAQKQREEMLLRNQANLEMERQRQREIQRQKQKQRQREMQIQREREMELQRQKQIEIQRQMQRQREIERQILIQREIERQRERQRERQIQKEIKIRREIEREKERERLERERQRMRLIQERQAEQALNKRMMMQRNYDLEDDLTSSVQSSIVNLHDHQLQQSRVQCYQCQIQRLRKQKQRAKQAIRQIQLQQAKRSQILMDIAQNTQLQADYYRNLELLMNEERNFNNSATIY